MELKKMSSKKFALHVRPDNIRLKNLMALRSHIPKLKISAKETQLPQVDQHFAQLNNPESRDFKLKLMVFFYLQLFYLIF